MQKLPSNCEPQLGGTRPSQRVDAEKYNWAYVGEVISVGKENSADAAAIVQGWMRSKEGHREAILGSLYTHIGVGVSYSSTGVPYYTEVFARLK